jgi:hypothetical protein
VYGRSVCGVFCKRVRSPRALELVVATSSPLFINADIRPFWSFWRLANADTSLDPEEKQATIDTVTGVL